MIVYVESRKNEKNYYEWFLVISFIPTRNKRTLLFVTETENLRSIGSIHSREISLPIRWNLALPTLHHRLYLLAKILHAE